MPKFEKGAVFLSPYPLCLYISQKKLDTDSSTFLSTLVPKECNFIAPPPVILQFLVAQFFSLLTPTMLNVEYIYVTYIANCNRINSVWVQCDNTAAKLFIGLLYKCNKFQKNCPKTTWKCCYIFLETKKLYYLYI